MRFLLITLLYVLPNIVIAQNPPCRVALKADKVADKLKLFYTGSVLADSLYLHDGSGISSGDKGHTVSKLGDGYYTTFIRSMSIDSTHVQTPKADLYYKDSLVCSVPVQWHWVDTVKGVKSETNLSKLPNEPDKPNFSEFKWEKGVLPIVVVDLVKSANVGDEIMVTFETNYPVSEVTSRLQSPTLVYDRVVSMSNNISIRNGITTRQYTTTLAYRVVKPGTVAFEAMKFKVAGKKARMSEIGINIPMP